MASAGSGSRGRGVEDFWPTFEARPAGPIHVGLRRRSDADDAIRSRRRASSLVVLDARTLSEMARASVSHYIPFGFHGLYAD
jgi:hypothetical protein